MRSPPSHLVGLGLVRRWGREEGRAGGGGDLEPGRALVVGDAGAHVRRCDGGAIDSADSIVTIFRLFSTSNKLHLLLSLTHASGGVAGGEAAHWKELVGAIRTSRRQLSNSPALGGRRRSRAAAPVSAPSQHASPSHTTAV